MLHIDDGNLTVIAVFQWWMRGLSYSFRIKLGFQCFSWYLCHCKCNRIEIELGKYIFLAQSQKLCDRRVHRRSLRDGFQSLGLNSAKSNAQVCSRANLHEKRICTVKKLSYIMQPSLCLCAEMFLLEWKNCAAGVKTRWTFQHTYFPGHCCCLTSRVSVRCAVSLLVLSAQNLQHCLFADRHWKLVVSTSKYHYQICPLFCFISTKRRQHAYSACGVCSESTAFVNEKRCCRAVYELSGMFTSPFYDCLVESNIAVYNPLHSLLQLYFL